MLFLRYVTGQTDRQTDRHIDTHNNTLHFKVTMTMTVWQCSFSSYEREIIHELCMLHGSETWPVKKENK